MEKVAPTEPVPAAVPAAEAPVRPPAGRLEVPLGRFCDLVGIHSGTAATWVREGLPVSREGKTSWVDLAAGIRWLRQRYEREAEARGADYEAERAKKTKFDARLRELSVRKQEGELVEASEVEARWGQIASAFREAVLVVPGIAVQSGVVPRASERRLEAIVRDALSSLGPK